ncbi:2-hydroxychromene-2-carboxylate isomerase [Janthinobacterium agaricidamnosum]|uniref:2-hydroxychromene-2-carboxylate isomerase n=1 Tax=Janthinobacterium agaricidamnosum NBRC 102515 = DSM 9628 TaxID=1349767 RepID=W0V9X4_9BURK|nr:2-hydroxychromene-2-carboxylate isomerase [Janthinobacterium agaricidamnosum]CDG84691.1 DSBA-like thioredoxin domain protein [Janthinobacterium agaricidamnosum NBRC 102515 = DSM 9628]
MPKSVEFYFDVGSPAAYLAWTQLPGICRHAGAELIYKPMLLGGVFQATGNTSPATIPAKGQYTHRDYQRFASRYGAPFASNPHFPVNTLFLMRAVAGIQIRQPERLRDFLKAVFSALWGDGLNLNDPLIAVKMLVDAGYDAEQIVMLTNDVEVKAALRANTDEAVARGVFGAPTMFVAGEMYFGQDRLDFVRDALA